MLKVIIHNDDFGLNYGFSYAIHNCFIKGVTTSTSLRVNGTAYDHSVKKILPKINKIGLGLHLNLTDGKNYKSFIKILFATIVKRRKTLNWVQKEFEKQFLQTIQKDKLKIDHIDSESHIHMIPPIFKIAVSLCRKYKVGFIRNSNENYYLTGDLKTDLKPFINSNIIRFLVLKCFAFINQKTLKDHELKTSDCFYGILHTGEMNQPAFLGALRNALKNNYQLVEILSHPAIKTDKDRNFTSPFIKKYTAKIEREIEAGVLKSQEVKRFIRKNKIKLVNFKTLN